MSIIRLTKGDTGSLDPKPLTYVIDYYREH